MLTLCTHASPRTCTLLGNMQGTHTLRIQQRGLIGGGQTGGIPSYVLSTNQCRQGDKHGCNRILAAHCVPSPPRKKPQLASPYFLQTVNLLVYSILNLRELNIFFRHKYHTGVSPIYVLTLRLNNKRIK